MNWWRQHRDLDSVAWTRHIARLRAIVLKITVLSKSPHQTSGILFFIISWQIRKKVLLCGIAKRDWWKKQALSLTFSQSDWLKWRRHRCVDSYLPRRINHQWESTIEQLLGWFIHRRQGSSPQGKSTIDANTYSFFEKKLHPHTIRRNIDPKTFFMRRNWLYFLWSSCEEAPRNSPLRRAIIANITTCKWAQNGGRRINLWLADHAGPVDYCR